MTKYSVTIVIATDADPSALLDAALESGRFFYDETSEYCTVDEDETSVTEVEE